MIRILIEFFYYPTAANNTAQIVVEINSHTICTVIGTGGTAQQVFECRGLDLGWGTCLGFCFNFSKSTDNANYKTINLVSNQWLFCRIETLDGITPRPFSSLKTL